MQLPGLRFVQFPAPIPNADRRKGRFTGRLEVRMFSYQRIKMLRLAYIIVDPFADLVCAVPLETHPHLEPAKTSRLLEAVNIVLVALMRAIGFVCQIRRLEPKRRGQPTIILDQDRARLERRVEPFVWINGE